MFEKTICGITDGTWVNHVQEKCLSAILSLWSFLPWDFIVKFTQHHETAPCDFSPFSSTLCAYTQASNLHESKFYSTFFSHSALSLQGSDIRNIYFWRLFNPSDCISIYLIEVKRVHWMLTSWMVLNSFLHQHWVIQNFRIKVQKQPQLNLLQVNAGGTTNRSGRILLYRKNMPASLANAEIRDKSM